MQRISERKMQRKVSEKTEKNNKTKDNLEKDLKLKKIFIFSEMKTFFLKINLK